MFFALQPPNAVVVRVAEQPVESTSVTDILIGAIGLTGVLVLAAVVLGALLGGAMIGLKMLRARYNPEPPSDRDAMRVTPHSTT